MGNSIALTTLIALWACELLIELIKTQSHASQAALFCLLNILLFMLSWIEACCLYPEFNKNITNVQFSGKQHICSSAQRFL